MVKRRSILLLTIFILGTIAILASLHLLPLNILSIQQKPEQAPQKVYDYYLIIDETDNQTLMYVPLVVSVGDEVITEENKRYQIVKVEENRAYARFVEYVDIKQYQQKPK
ncbi:MAG TPA: stage II sporulation protein P [Selenomonadales bacterium]|nr:stage II sporulation protein P [Selenomonadales bacterium]